VAKATALGPEALTVRASTPPAATKPRTARPVSAVLSRAPVNDTPLQIRVPRAEAKAIKVAAAQAEQSISEFLLACFHAYKPPLR
jgi:hypothetical protein